MPISTLPQATRHLLQSAPLYPTYESAVTALFTRLHPLSTSTSLILHPEALRFTIVYTPANPTHSPPVRELQALSTIASVDLHTPQRSYVFRDGKEVDDPTLPDSMDGSEEGEGEKGEAGEEEGDGVITVHVWELFSHLPIRRRLEATRSGGEALSKTRDSIIRAALLNPTRRLKIASTGMLYTYHGALTSDALQAAFGLSVTWLPLHIRAPGGSVQGLLAREGARSGRYQIASRSGREDFHVGEGVREGWGRGRGRGCAAFVVFVEGVVEKGTVVDGVREALGEGDVKRMTLGAGTRMGMGKRRKPLVRRERFLDALPIGSGAKKRPVSEGRVSVKVSHVKRPASAVEDAYRRMVPSWQNPCLPSRARGVSNVVYDQRSVCMRKDRIAGMRIVGQVDRKFIVVADEQGVFAVDQHAASERHHYETMLKKCDTQRGSRKLANPRAVIIPVELRQHSERVLRRAESWGWRFDTANRVTHVPLLAGLDAFIEPESLIEWYEEFAEGARGIPRGVTRVVASAACHAAVRFGDSLTRMMCMSIVGRLAECEVPFLCAHGRPNVVPLVVFDDGHL